MQLNKALSFLVSEQVSLTKRSFGKFFFTAFWFKKHLPIQTVDGQSHTLSKLDVSGIIEKFNVYDTLAIIPRRKNFNEAFYWLLISFVLGMIAKVAQTLNFSIIPETSIGLAKSDCTIECWLDLWMNFSTMTSWLHFWECSQTASMTTLGKLQFDRQLT